MLLAAPAVCWAGTKTCLTGTAPEVAGDAAEIRAVRQIVHDVCVCASYDGSAGKQHVNYVKCASLIIAAQAKLGNLRTQCKVKALGAFAQSTCGRNPSLHYAACIKRSSKTGAVTCAIASTTKKDGSTPSAGCIDGKTFTKAPCFGFTNCLDAADTNNNLLIAAPGDGGSCQATACVRGRALVQGAPLAGGAPVYIYSTNPAPVCPGTPDAWGTLSAQGVTAADDSGAFCVDFPLAPLNHPADPIRADRWVLPADCAERESVLPGSGFAPIWRSLTDTNNATCGTNPDDCIDVGDVNLCGSYGC